MADDGLDDVERHPGIGGKRYEGVPERMKSSFRRFTAPPFQLNGCYDIGGIKDFRYALTYPPSRYHIRIRYRRDNKTLSFIY